MSKSERLDNVEIEKLVKADINSRKARIYLPIEGNVQLVNEQYNRVRSEKSAFAVEWMIKAEDTVNNLLRPFNLKHSNGLGVKLKQRFKSDLSKIKQRAEEIRRDDRSKKVPFKEIPIRGKNIEITFKWTPGSWGERKLFCAVNIVIPKEYLKKSQKKYYISLTKDEVEELMYRALFCVSANDIYKGRGLETAEKVFGKII